MRYIVTLGHGAGHSDYGPFDDHRDARRFTTFLSREVDPARVFELYGEPVRPLQSPLLVLLAWYEQHGRGLPSLRATKIGDRP